MNNEKIVRIRRMMVKSLDPYHPCMVPREYFHKLIDEYYDLVTKEV